MRKFYLTSYLHAIAKRILPTFAFNVIRYFKGKGIEQISWKGSYANWPEALINSNGYSDYHILNKIRSSQLKVKNGEEIYERDSVLFSKIQYSWPLLACLQNVAIANNNRLKLIDFGGSLGTSYYQNKIFLRHLASIKWVVVEQKHFVDCGKTDFEDESLTFEYTVAEANKNLSAQCLLLSGVLQYLSDPMGQIEEFLNFNFEYILIDRTGFTKGGANILTLQTVPPEIYKATYPCWFFDEEKFKHKIEEHYVIISEFDDSFTTPVLINGCECYWKGFYLKSKHEKSI